MHISRVLFRVPVFSLLYLLDLVRKSGFGEILPKLLDQGKIYVGASAGSIITGLTIEPAGWFEGGGDRNDVGLTDITGLQLIPFTIFPHVIERHKPKLVEKSMSEKYPIIGLSDTQAIMSKDETFQIVGVGEKLIYNPQFLKNDCSLS